MNIVADARRGLAMRPGLQLQRCAFIKEDSTGSPRSCCALSACYLGHNNGQFPTGGGKPFDDRGRQILKWATVYYQKPASWLLGFVDGFDGRDEHRDDLASYTEGYQAGKAAFAELLPAETMDVTHTLAEEL
jgi:hypothetical protein